MATSWLLKCCHTYCGVGNDEARKLGLLSIPGENGEWEHDEVAAAKREYKKHSIHVKAIEDTISENVKQRLEERHRLTVFARQVNAMECPRTYPKSKEDQEFLDKVLLEDKDFVFCDFRKKERQFMLDILQKDASIKKGDLLYTVGDIGDYFYIIDEGSVEIIDGYDAASTRILRRGDAFGELALLFDVPRITTARAQSDCVLWKMHQHCYRAKLAHHAMLREEEMVSLLRPLPLFENMDEASLRKFANAMERVFFDPGARIVNKGDVGNVGYIITEGTVMMHDIGVGDSTQTDIELNAGETFGIRSLLTGERRHANCTAKTSVAAWAVDRETFETLFGPLHQAIQHQMKRRFLQSINMFSTSDITTREYDRLADRLKKVCREKGYSFDQVGEPYKQELVVIESGRVAVYDGNEENSEVFVLKGGDVYGDKNIRDPKFTKSAYNVVCEERAIVWSLCKDDIKEIIGDLDRLGQSKHFHHTRRVSSYFDDRVLMKDLEKLQVLGVGGFGKVWLVRHKITQAHYALKELNKRRILDRKQAKNVLREKGILATLEHPFILGEVSSFQDESNLYILTNLIQGGELYRLIVDTGGKGLPKKSAIFYSACIYAALAHLHARNICYRDLKPENVMIDKDGYCVLVDLGFAKVVTTKTFTLCGTPEYLAPEVFMSQGHDKAADLWSYGVLLYELITGKSAFYKYGQKQVEMFKRIVRVQYNISLVLDDTAKDLVQRLLVRNPAKRLGNGLQGIEDHPWFETMDWAVLPKKEIPAPWIPQIQEGTAVLGPAHDATNGAYNNISFGKPLSMEEQSIFKSF